MALKDSAKLKVAIIEENPAIATRYKNYIDSSARLECVASASSAENFLKHVNSFQDLDILLLDIELPGISGIQAIPKIKFKIPQLNIIMATNFTDDESIFQSIRSGATGYLLKDCTQYEMQKYLLSIPEGGAPISPLVAMKIINYFNPPKTTFLRPKGKYNLTKKEKLVVHNLVKGLTYQEIANQMEVSINSVRFHVKNIYTKLQVKSRNKLIDKLKAPIV